MSNVKEVRNLYHRANGYLASILKEYGFKESDIPLSHHYWKAKPHVVDLNRALDEFNIGKDERRVIENFSAHEFFFSGLGENASPNLPVMVDVPVAIAEVIQEANNEPVEPEDDYVNPFSGLLDT